jgi:DNA (cytosine-5)-methyltransferase 1
VAKYKIIDLFSGVGGLSLGFSNTKFDLVLGADIDTDAGNTFIQNHPKSKFYLGDIKNLNASQIKKLIGNTKIDILVGGVPCQSFSMVGNRTTNKKGNLNDPRHYLFREFIRVAKILKPKIVVIENVKGILSAHKGEIKNEIIIELEKIGFKVDYKLLNSAEYGVAQLRERVVFLGNNLGIKNIFPKKTHSPQNYVCIKEVFKDLPKFNHEPRLLKGKVLERVKLIKPGENWKVLPKELQTGSKHSGAYGRLDPNRPSRTLTTRFDTPPGGYVTHPKENRAITVREGARIQGFPDNFVFTGNRSSQYRQVGNAVPVGLSKALSLGILKMLASTSK